jgi:DNA topoisomerase-3
VRGYQIIDVDLSLPDIRSFIEQQITLIGKGLADHAAVVQHSLQEFSAKFKYFVSQVGATRDLQASVLVSEHKGLDCRRDI